MPPWDILRFFFLSNLALISLFLRLKKNKTPILTTFCHVTRIIKTWNHLTWKQMRMRDESVIWFSVSSQPLLELNWVNLSCSYRLLITQRLRMRPTTVRACHWSRLNLSPRDGGLPLNRFKYLSTLCISNYNVNETVSIFKRPIYLKSTFKYL